MVAGAFMSGYHHTQPTPRVMIIISPAVLALIALISSELRITLVGVIVALAIGFYLFSSLTVEVSDQDLQWYFGPGLLRNVEPSSQGYLLDESGGRLEKFFSPSLRESDSGTARENGQMERASHGTEGFFRS